MFTSKENFRKQYLERFKEVTGESFEEGSMQEKYNVLASLIMKYAGTYMADTKSRMDKNNNQKRVYYFSMEYLIGKLLIMNLHNMGIYNIVEDGLKDLGLDIRDLENIETDPGLGHGGLGRLAACFMDSLAFLNIPAVGMGIRYRYGSFQQKIVDGQQVELPNRWLHNEYPWEIKKASKSEIIKFYGKIKVEKIEDRLQFIHEDYEAVTAVPYDIPQIDFDSNDVNYIRLWSAENAYGFDLESFNNGDYLQAVKNKANVEAITHVLYPNDANYNGRLLRLKQQYFFVSAGLKSIIRRYKRNNDNFDKLADKIQIQINDTHPSLVIPELMRILIDEEGLDWDYSWNLVNNVCSYTNHTILTEALEKWPIDMMKKLLPRVYMIIEEINRRFIDNAIPIEKDIKMRNSILRDGVVHMANLSVIGSKSVNGVSKLHSDIIKNETFKELYKLYPWKFNSKTNGVSHRRFLLKANPDLRKFLSEAIGPEWEKDAEKLLSR
jgi:starch phosphorylase